jgi:hypothetical protein
MYDKMYYITSVRGTRGKYLNYLKTLLYTRLISILTTKGLYRQFAKLCIAHVAFKRTMIKTRLNLCRGTFDQEAIYEVRCGSGFPGQSYYQSKR